MKYCSQCGKELVDEAVVCPNCGCAVQAPANQQEDKPSAGLNILAFLFPVIGLILFLCFQKTTPVRAKAIGKWALARRRCALDPERGSGCLSFVKRACG